MAIVFPYSNTTRAASDYMGRQLFRLKEAMVSAGWTVRASGDGGTGTTRYAFNATPPTQATGGGASTLDDTGRGWTVNQWTNATVEITSGTGAGQTRTVSSNTGTQLTVSSAWATAPDAISFYSLTLTATTPGSGGAYDVWVTGNARNNSTPVTAGDAGNAKAWCLLECGTTQRRQVLLQTTSGTGTGASGYSGYVTICYTPLLGAGDANAMLGVDCDPNVAPAPSVTTYNVLGSPDSIGSDLGGFNTAGYYFIWYDADTAEDGAPAAVGMVSVDTSTETAKYIIFAGLDVASPTAADDPFCVLTTGAGGPYFGGYAWNPDAAAVNSIYSGLDGSWTGGGASATFDHSTTQWLPIVSGYDGMGRIHRSAGMQCSSQAAWGDRGTDQNGLVFVQLGQTYGLLVPWVAEATAPLPGTNSILNFYDIDPVAGTPVTYYQKVWDTGGGGRWCYYSGTTINPSPLSGDTVPNWTGTISTPIVISVSP